MLGIGTGCLGLTVPEFYEMRPAHFFLMLFEYNRKAEQDYRAGAELVRLQTATLVNIQLKKSDQVKPNQLWHFPWDDEQDVQKRLGSLTREELEEQVKQFLKFKKDEGPGAL